MAGDFEILRPPKAPFWRDPKKRPKEIGLERFILVTLSLFSACLMFIPTRLGGFAPISLELASGSKTSWLMFGLLGVALIYLAAKFAGAQRFLSSALCLLAIVGLGSIAFTDPLSAGHLTIFVMLCLMIVVWLWSLYVELEDFKLGVAAAACTVGSISCLLHLGIGERMVILSALFGINAAFYDYILI